MAYEESPQLDDFKNGIPNTLPDHVKNQRRNRRTIGILIFIFVILSVINSRQFRVLSVLISGTGSVTGTVVNEFGQPILAEIFVIGTDIEDRTGLEGNFIVDGIPSGKQSIVLAVQEGGVEYKVDVIAGSIVNLGRIQLVSTPTAGE
jgi:hypothetical protein